MFGLILYLAGSLIWTALTILDFCRDGPWRQDLAVALLFVVLGAMHRSRMGEETT